MALAGTAEAVHPPNIVCNRPHCFERFITFILIMIGRTVIPREIPEWLARFLVASVRAWKYITETEDDSDDDDEEEDNNLPEEDHAAVASAASVDDVAAPNDQKTQYEGVEEAKKNMEASSETPNTVAIQDDEAQG